VHFFGGIHFETGLWCKRPNVGLDGRVVGNGVLSKKILGVKRLIAWASCALALTLPVAITTPVHAKTATQASQAKKATKTTKSQAVANSSKKSGKQVAMAPAPNRSKVPGKARGKAVASKSAAQAVKSSGRLTKASGAKANAKVASKSRLVRVKRGGRFVWMRVAAPAVVTAAPMASMGHQIGLQNVDEGLELKSSVAFVIDQDTNEVLLNKNSRAVLPIASITKLMTAVIVTEANLPMDEALTVSPEDVEATAGSRSRLALGTQLSRNEMLHLALMASENRAAHVLGRSYPGGMQAFVAAMNAKASALGMADTRYVEPTGLSVDNRSSALDLTRLVRAAYKYPNIRDLSTSLEAVVGVGEQHKQTQFRNTNGLVRNPEWEIGLQKTGYISAAGRCLVMQAQLAGRKLIMVLLDSAGKYSRLGDAERIKNWLAAAPALPGLTPAGATALSPQAR
jgi:serine-type D-Ala-D-Ala endopeptidase (penicillin-binding protein 7)